MIYQSIFVWEAVTIDGNYVHGISQNVLKYQLKKDLSQKGLFQIKVQYMPIALSKKPLKSDTRIRSIQVPH